MGFILWCPKNPISLRDILSPTELASVASLISRINYMLQFNYGFARENPGLSEGCKVLENMMSGHRPPESPPTKPLCRNCFNSGIEQGCIESLYATIVTTVSSG